MNKEEERIVNRNETVFRQAAMLLAYVMAGVLAVSLPLEAEILQRMPQGRPSLSYSVTLFDATESERVCVSTGNHAPAMVWKVFLPNALGGTGGRTGERGGYGIEAFYRVAEMNIWNAAIVEAGVRGECPLLRKRAFGEGPVYQIINPYAGIDWATDRPYKANVHTHTTNSDGLLAPAAVIDAYKALNYDVLALTDHNGVSFPWTAYDRDPDEINMVAIAGNELSFGHHIVSLFSSYTSTSAVETTLLAEVGAVGGIAFFAHPGRYSFHPEWYAAHYRAYPHCLGQEIHNQGDRYPGDRATWDAVLTLLMPSRPVWGFSTDDAHQPSEIGRNRIYLWMKSLSTSNVYKALCHGAFYSTYSSSSTQTPPALTGVFVNESVGTITIQGTGYTEVRWISRGVCVSTGETIAVTRTPGVASYVRAELHGPEGIAYSNPFGLLPVDHRQPHAPFVPSTR